MSIDHAREFLAKIATDEGLAKTASGLSGQALVALAQQLGYVFSESELQQATAGVQESDKLSDADLEQVSGGLVVESTFSGTLLEPTAPLSQDLLRPVSGGLLSRSRYTR